jgi:hypothetical protein
MQEVDINYAALLVSTVMTFGIGALWHGPLFGKQWMAMMGFTPESIKNMTMTPQKAMACGFIGLLVTAYILAHFAAAFGATGVSGAFQLTFWIWLGFIAPALLNGLLWEGRSVKLYFFNIAYHFVALFAMALVLVLWR